MFLDTLPETTGDQVTAGAVSINGRTYEHGLQFDVSWTGSELQASYSIPQGARNFSAVIGNDDNQPNELWASIPVLYEVFIDDRRVAVGHAKGRTHDPPFQVQVGGGGTIELKVTNVGDHFGGAVADWGNPVFR